MLTVFPACLLTAICLVYRMEKSPLLSSPRLNALLEPHICPEDPEFPLFCTPNSRSGDTHSTHRLVMCVEKEIDFLASQLCLPPFEHLTVNSKILRTDTLVLYIKMQCDILSKSILISLNFSTFCRFKTADFTFRTKRDKVKWKGKDVCYIQKVIASQNEGP